MAPRASAAREKRQKLEEEEVDVQLPKELVGTILGMAGVPYNRKLCTDLGLNRDLLEYAGIALRERESRWAPLIDTFRTALERLSRHLKEREGRGNMFTSWDVNNHGAFCPDRLLAAWPRYWYQDEHFEDPEDFFEAYPSRLDQEMADAVGNGTIDTTFTIENPLTRRLVVHGPEVDGWSVTLGFMESVDDRHGNAEGDMDALSRSMVLKMKKEDKVEIEIEIDTENDGKLFNDAVGSKSCGGLGSFLTRASRSFLRRVSQSHADSCTRPQGSVVASAQPAEAPIR